MGALHLRSPPSSSCASLLAAVLACAGCGLANGVTSGGVRSPFAADDAGGGEGEGEGEGESGCAADEAACWADDDLCDRATGACADADDVTAWCAAANAFDPRENDGPLVELATPVARDAGCVTASLAVRDLQGDVPTAPGVPDVEFALGAAFPMFAQVDGVTQQDVDGVAQVLVVDVRACAAVADDATIAFVVYDSARHRSNRVCSDAPE